ncbi:Spo11/DNA topoisomerase VI, subunit A, N-terminal [Dillenia turbinata]|uniref:Spo11/DNA topoisomerase VI, subunit A, N-terminal n=1 Tax=Dillenia turbinata TaxID=194707 RepID=A0AAN8ZRW8_9MAGN
MDGYLRSVHSVYINIYKMVMELCLQTLVQGKRVTQRELFYKLLCASSEYFTSRLLVNQTIQDIVALLKCSRFSLGIMASGLLDGFGCRSNEPAFQTMDDIKLA